MAILNIDLTNINLDDTNYEEHDPDTIILIRLLDWHNKFERRKVLRKKKKKISEELIPVAWNRKRWNFCVSEGKKNEIDLIFIEEL